MSDKVIDSISEQLRSRVVELCVEHKLIGAAVGVVRDQALAWSHGFGFADLETEQPPDEHTVFRIGSITKTFTATAIFQLRDEGKLQLDDPIEQYIPEFSAVQARKGSVEAVTLRRLLCHHSGIMFESPGNQWETLEFPSMEEIMAILPQVGVVIEPDSAFKYSNLGFALLGEVVTRVSRRPYEEYVRGEILEKLDMNSSVFELTESLSSRMATGYELRPYEDLPKTAPPYTANGYAAGGQLYSTVTDLAKWLVFQFRNDVSEDESTQVLADRSLKEMQRAQFLEPGWRAGYCLPWTAKAVGEDVYLGHGGAVPGFLTRIDFNPERRLGVIVLTNTDGHSASASMAQEIIKAVTVADAAQQKTATFRKPTPTPEEWRDYIGAYTTLLFGWQIEIECRDGALLLYPPDGDDGIPLHELDPADDPDAFLVSVGHFAGETLRFRRSDDGTVTGFVIEAGGFSYTKLVPSHNS